MYGSATAVGMGEVRWSIKLNNSDEEEKEPVTKMEVEHLMHVYRENIDNKSQDHCKVIDERNLNDELSHYYKPQKWRYENSKTTRISTFSQKDR